MKKIFLFATMFAISLSMLGQEYMHVWQDGKKTDYVVTEVDSVTFNKMMHNGHEYVDLGLPSGTLWATCNVGANKPEEYGDYFAWGETESKSTYNDFTYKWFAYEIIGTYRRFYATKYCTNETYGIVDNKTTLELSDDAAHANWGGNWRMPTAIEQNELYSECTSNWTTHNGVNGYKFVGSNGNSIFLPAAGYCSSIDEIQKLGEEGQYWSSSLDTTMSKFAYLFCCDSNSIRYKSVGFRVIGESIRPVCTQNSMSQREMYIWQNGGKTTFVVADVDSVTFSDSNLTNPTTPNGGIGVFSVSPDKQVTFSKGNLQYTRSTDTWSFASTQWEMIGTDNVTNDSVFSNQFGYHGYGDALADKVDLFGWSTSATNFGVSTSQDFEGGYSGSFVDWGNNRIGNDAHNTWRTLSYNEWGYLLNYRPHASSLKGVAQVNGVNGLIFLPDNWTCPAGVTFKSDFHSNYGVDYYAAYQTFTAAEWSKLEAAGAVFLPAAGFRRGSDVPAVQHYGDYWSATEGGRGGSSNSAYFLYFYSDRANMGGDYRYHGQSVRLVKDIDGSNTPNNPNDDPDNPNNPNDDPDDSDDPIVITGVTVKAKVPAHWIDLITVWVWPTGGEGEEFIPVREGDWYVYTHTAGTELNIIFKNGFGWNGARNQTIDITGITQNTCIKIEQEGSGKATYTIVDCLSGEEDKEEDDEDDEDDEEPEKPETPATGMENGYEWVDLGLSVKWATCNVGATKPEEYGDYFAWGEIQPKEVYNWSTYKWNKDDAARANWGGAWRLPTKAEQDELREQCTWEEAVVYGIRCTKVTGPNGNSIFLPKAGYSYDGMLANAGGCGYYWSSSPYTTDTNYACCLYFDSEYEDWFYYYYRCCGLSIRPVCQ